MAPKLSNLKIVLGHWNENMNQNFRFNNPKQFSNRIIYVSFCSSHLAIKIVKMFIWCKFTKSIQKSIFPRKFKKVCALQRKHEQFQTQLSRKLQRFRTCRKNKKCSMFHDLSEYIISSFRCRLLNWSFKNCKKDWWVLFFLRWLQ